MARVLSSALEARAARYPAGSTLAGDEAALRRLANGDRWGGGARWPAPSGPLRWRGGHGASGPRKRRRAGLAFAPFQLVPPAPGSRPSLPPLAPARPPRLPSRRRSERAAAARGALQLRVAERTVLRDAAEAAAALLR
jgi:hypothetical protein